jgi:hypothetical protein
MIPIEHSHVNGGLNLAHPQFLVAAEVDVACRFVLGLTTPFF